MAILSKPDHARPHHACGALPHPGTPFGQPRLFRFHQHREADRGRSVPRLRPFRPACGHYIAARSGSERRRLTLRDTGLTHRGLDRYTANILGHFDVSDRLPAVLRLKMCTSSPAKEGSELLTGRLLGTSSAGNPTSPRRCSRNADGRALRRSRNGPTAAATFPVSASTSISAAAPRSRPATPLRGVIGVSGRFQRGLELRSRVQLRPLRAAFGRAERSRPVRYQRQPRRLSAGL